MSYKFWADVNNQAIVYYAPISENEAIKLNNSQDDFYTSEYVELEAEVGRKIDDVWLRPRVKHMSGENFWSWSDF